LLTGIRRSHAEIAFALARALDYEEVTAPAPIARELAARLDALNVMAGGEKTVVDELAEKRRQAQAEIRQA